MPQPQHSRNLTPQRGPDVWARTDREHRTSEHLFRWLAGASGAILVTAGLRGRSRGSHLFTIAGATLVGLALSEQRSHDVLEFAERHRSRRRHRDAVTDASASSFPASDSPSWTPTTGSGAPDRRVTR